MEDPSTTYRQLIDEVSSLKQEIEKLERLESDRRKTEEKLEKRIAALTQPLEDYSDIEFEDLFDLDEIQRLQDEFCSAIGVASVITRTDGTPITKPSNFSRLCSDIIRKTEAGEEKCRRSDAYMGQYHPEGPVVQPCRSAGLWGAGASITAGGRHIANWLIGQVRNEAQSEEDARAYARELGVDEKTFIDAFYEVPVMSTQQFHLVAQALFTVASLLSRSAFQNLQQARYIIERKRAREALLASEEKYRELVESANSIILRMDADGVVTFFNEYASSFLGFSREEIVGRNVAETIMSPAASAGRDVSEMVRDLSAHPERFRSYENEVRRKDGTPVSIAWTSRPILDGKGRCVEILCIGNDITKRRQAQEELAVSRDRLARAEIISRSGHWELDVVSGRLLQSEGTRRILGLVGAQSTMAKARETLLPEYRDVTDGALRALIEHDAPFDVEFKARRQDSGEIVHVHSVAEYDRHRNVVFGIMRDITEHKRVEEELNESRRRLEDIIEFLPDATLVIDREGKVIAWNRAIETLTGVRKDNMLGKGDYQYSIPFYGERRPLLIDYALHPELEMEHKYLAFQRVGDILYGEAFTPGIPPGDFHVYATASVLHDSKGNVIAAIECIRDDTERRKLADRLNRAEKMEGLGRLAGGVAHDMNNVLGVLVGCADLLRASLPKDTPYWKFADDILNSGLRGAAIIQDLLTLARRGVAVSQVVNLNTIITDYLGTPEFEKLKSDHPAVNIKVELAEGLLNTRGSPIHLNKTLANLIFNAVEALPDSGEIRIRTENRYLDYPIQGYDSMKEGDYAVLVVSDTGKGISDRDLGKVFEPFYTNKVMGRSGTGLGLAVVWGTVKDHDGYIDVRSEEGVGSTFTIYLPVTREEMVQRKKTIDSLACRGKGETILVVDDIREQRELACNMLSALGYDVEAVASGEEAVERMRVKKADLMLLDMIMEPGMDGLETYRRVLEIHPGQKAVIVSGFSETSRVRKAQELGAGAFVRKPYIMVKIGIAVRRELDRREGDGTPPDEA